jgi:hypothetical protein
MTLVMSGLRPYVLCPNCSDAIVADSSGLPPQGSGEAECVNCHKQFSFTPDHVHTGLLFADDRTGRWTVGKSKLPGEK